jgi:hypothetical protein
MPDTPCATAAHGVGTYEGTISFEMSSARTDVLSAEYRLVVSRMQVVDLGEYKWHD